LQSVRRCDCSCRESASRTAGRSESSAASSARARRLTPANGLNQARGGRVDRDSNFRCRTVDKAVGESIDSGAFGHCSATLSRLHHRARPWPLAPPQPAFTCVVHSRCRCICGCAHPESDLPGILVAKIAGDESPLHDSKKMPTAGHNAAPPNSASFSDHEFRRSV
jgi:hypothetical protein